MEAALEAANIPFYGGPGFTDHPDHRAFLRLLRTARSDSDVRIAEVRSLLERLGADVDALWIFDGRAHAANEFNQLLIDGLLEFDGGKFGSDDLSNNSIETINRKLWRSGIKAWADTICSIVGVDADTIDERFRKYNTQY